MQSSVHSLFQPPPGLRPILLSEVPEHAGGAQGNGHASQPLLLCNELELDAGGAATGGIRRQLECARDKGRAFDRLKGVRPDAGFCVDVR